MKEVTFTVTLSLAGPIITGSTAAGDFGVDLPFARDNDGQCYLPGTQVKGRLREALQTLSQFVVLSPDDLHDWFGQGSQRDDQPERGRLIFGDFVSRHPRLDAVRTRIRIDPEREAVQEGAYLVIEAPFTPGDKIDFTGTIRFLCQDPEIPKIKEAIEKGLRWIPALGGQRSVGFGRLTGVDIQESSRNVPSSVNPPSSCDALRIELYPQAPFCISRPRTDENLFESEPIIPGGVLKGCLANTLNQILGRPLNSILDEYVPPPWDQLGRHFSRIRLDHAFPTPKGQAIRPHHYPLSLVRAEKKTYDVALCERPGLIEDRAPAFLSDWKPSDEEAVGREFGWGNSLLTTLRVRTAMDSGTRRAAEGKLFAYEMVVPQGYVWHGRVDLTRIPEGERAGVCSQLEALLQLGLKYLGKTKVDVEVKVFPSLPPTIPDPLDDDLWVVTLQTPALMADPKSLTPHALVDPSILLTAYRKFWAEVSDHGLELVRFFARQRLLGGGYLHHRFRPGESYNPFLVTVERSVFILKLIDKGRQEEMKGRLGLWSSQGLPLPKWAKEAYGESWQTCPFIPENGFGEVAINMGCHQDNRPNAGIYTEV